MQEKEIEKKSSVDAMHKRRVVMADGRRYLIYYTFETDKNLNAASDGHQPGIETQNSASGEEIRDV